MKKLYNAGDEVGHVTLLSYDSIRHMWFCRCKCGNECYKSASSLHNNARCLVCYRRSEEFKRYCWGHLPLKWRQA